MKPSTPAALLCCACSAFAAPEKVPDKTVVMTFDDSVKSHLTVAAPLLKKHGFGATFFVTQAWMGEKDNYLDWQEIAKLDRMGFEIGNHSWSHMAMHGSEAAGFAEEEILKMERALAKVGVPKPTSFSWPGNHFGPETHAALRKLGYRFARRGPQPGIPSSETLGAGEPYDPAQNDPLLVPTSGLAVPSWTLEDFKKIVAPAKDGKIVVLQLHGTPDRLHPACSAPPGEFKAFVEYLADENFNVIAMRDLGKYVDSDHPPEDLLALQRFHRPDEPIAIPVKVEASKARAKPFLGFGAEWDSFSYDDNGVDEKDFATIAKRIEWMRIPLLRVMMLAKWCYLGDGQYDWNTRDMRELYRHLDLCQKLGISVYLTEWGCNGEWLEVPDVGSVADKKYAEIIGTYLDHLVSEKGYSCIKAFIFVNEPNLGAYGWEPWKKGVENVSAELKRRGLDRQIRFAGSDQSNGDDWHNMAVDQLRDCFGIYDNHKYANDEMVRPGKLFGYYKTLYDYALEHDREAATKPFIVGEAGLNDFARHPFGNKKIDTPYYGLFMADYAVQAVNAGSSAVFNWMLDDNSHQDFYWGLWKDKKHGLELRPCFHVWSLLSRCFPPGSAIHELGKYSADIRILAASIPNDAGGNDWSFCFVNRGGKPVAIELEIPGEGIRAFETYRYGNAPPKVDADGFPLPGLGSEIDLSKTTPLLCEGESVQILTTLPHP